jgi:hypothetical protein
MAEGAGGFNPMEKAALAGLSGPGRYLFSMAANNFDCRCQVRKELGIGLVLLGGIENE